MLSDAYVEKLLRNMHKNGAARPNNILGVSLEEGEIYFHVIWEKRNKIIGTHKCPHDLMKSRLHQLLIKYYEYNIVWDEHSKHN
ncbi:uncharacterized protein isoform X3 [Rhodnius prolixus]